MINNYISNGMRAEPGEFPFFVHYVFLILRISIDIAVVAFL